MPVCWMPFAVTKSQVANSAKQKKKRKSQEREKNGVCKKDSKQKKNKQLKSDDKLRVEHKFTHQQKQHVLLAGWLAGWRPHECARRARQRHPNNTHNTLCVGDFWRREIPRQACRARSPGQSRLKECISISSFFVDKIVFGVCMGRLHGFFVSCSVFSDNRNQNISFRPARGHSDGPIPIMLWTKSLFFFKTLI